MHTWYGAALRSVAPRRAIAVAAGLTVGLAAPALAQEARAPELVSPPDAVGEFVGLGLFPASDVTAFSSNGAFAGAPANGGTSNYVSTRTPDGWTTTPLPLGSSGVLFGISEDGASAVFNSPSAFDPEDVTPVSFDLFRYVEGAGIERISRGPLNDTGVSATFAAATPDLEHIVFESQSALVEPDDERAFGVGLYSFDSGTLTNIVPPDDAYADRGALLGGGQGQRQQALSADGTSVVLTSPAVPRGQTPNTIFVKHADGSVTKLTPGSTLRQIYAGAAADHSKVFLTTPEGLAAGDTDGSLDLYEVDVATGTPTRLSVGDLGGDSTGCAGPPQCAAEAVVVSDDGSTVAFLSPEVLAAGATLDRPNLYVRRGGQTSFVGSFTNRASTPTTRRMTADGSVLAFLTTDPLTAGDTDAQPDLYAFDTGTSTLTRLSSGPAADNGDLPVVLEPPDPGYFPPSTLLARPRVLTDDGRCAYFQTAEALTQDDGDQEVDVYESCDGVAGLLTPGTGGDASQYLNSSPDGSDVLVMTTDDLSVEDVDGGPSIYDLRRGGRIAPPPPSPCEGDACQPPPTPPPPGPPPPATAATGGPPSADAVLGQFIVSTPGGPQARRAARNGRVRVDVEVPAAGALTLEASGRVGGRMRTVGETSLRPPEAGVLELRLRLSRAARRKLRRHALVLAVTGQFVAPGVDVSDTDGVRLPRIRRKSR